MAPIVLFSIQFTMSVVAYKWYVQPRLSLLPRDEALAPLLWVR